MPRWNNRYGALHTRWSYWRHRERYDSEGNDLRGGNDEYYVAKCGTCQKHTEHDGCTKKCVECE